MAVICFNVFSRILPRTLLLTFPTKTTNAFFFSILINLRENKLFYYKEKYKKLQGQSWSWRLH